jgi:hypothetical protein
VRVGENVTAMQRRAKNVKYAPPELVKSIRLKFIILRYNRRNGPRISTLAVLMLEPQSGSLQSVGRFPKSGASKSTWPASRRVNRDQGSRRKTEM